MRGRLLLRKRVYRQLQNSKHNVARYIIHSVVLDKQNQQITSYIQDNRGCCYTDWQLFNTAIDPRSV